jgi:hypothetical protein
MRHFISLLLIVSAVAFAQQPKLDKPPQDVDDALRARIKQFYDYQVEGKARRCEALVAEESQDDFYDMAKLQINSYTVTNIDYFDNFTKAKAIITADRPLLFPGVGAKVMPQPFASYWKQVKGVWFWYYNKDESLRTPFGLASPGAKSGGATANMPDVTDPAKMIEQLQAALKIDRTRIDLEGDKPQTIKVTSTLPGLVTLSVDSPLMPIAKLGIIATLDKKELKGNETATLTLRADSNANPGHYPLQITVQPTQQVLSFTVNVSK